MWKNRIIYGGIVLVAIFLLLFYHHYFFFLLLLLLVALVPISIVVTASVAKEVSVEIAIPAMTIEEGNYAKIVFKVHNGRRIPLPAVVCKLHVENRFYPNEETQEMTFPLRSRDSEYSWSINPVYAGGIRIYAEEIVIWDFLKIWKTSIVLPAEKEIIALPQRSLAVVTLLEMYNEDGEEEEKDALNSVEDVTSIKELREFRPGDRLQRVHWKLSTKGDDLLVKEFEREWNRTVTLLPELMADDSQVGNLDLCMRAFYSTAMYLLEDDQIFMVKWYDAGKQSFREERVDSTDRLEDVIQQLFRMSSYEGREAYKHYTETEKGAMDMAIYFTDRGFSEYDSKNLLGVFENKVLIVCI